MIHKITTMHLLFQSGGGSTQLEEKCSAPKLIIKVTNKIIIVKKITET